MMKVLLAASEAVPFVKTGGLADVMGALPKSLAARGMDVRVVIPKYSQIGETWLKEMKEVTTGTVNLAWRQLYYGVEEIRKDGVRFYFIDNEQYFKRDKLYGFGDDAERFAYFCRAVLAMLPKIGFKPDVVHCNDWHTGLLGAFLKEDFIHDPFYVQMKVIYTIHNLKYQGIFDPFVMNDVIGLPYALFSGGKLECDGAVNYMKSGMVYADQITTVSPTYAEEITYPYFGERLDSYIRTCKARLTGIINGLDEDMYNPENDEFIPVQYTPATLQSGKRGNKQRLQRELGLPERNVPLFAIVTRLIEDKGMDLVLRIIDELLSEDIQFVLVGTGDSAYENAFRQAAQRHPTKMAVRILFHEALAHRVYAAADFFLMPSRYEPCGLSQLIALKYGTVPIVRETGGLKDTVIPFDKYTGKGNGLSFLNFNAHELLCTAKQGLGYYEVPVIWEQLVKNAAASDYGWQRSAAAYAALYEKVSEN